MNSRQEGSQNPGEREKQKNKARRRARTSEINWMVQSPRSKEERASRRRYLLPLRGGAWSSEATTLEFDKQELTGASLVSPEFSGGGREVGTL